MPTAPELTVHRSITKALKLFDEDRLRWLDEATAIGPLVALRMGPVKTWIVTDPEAARTMLVTDDHAWVRPPTVRAPITLAVGDNLFSLSNRAWAATQPLVAPAFRRKALEQRLAGMQPIIDDEVRALAHDTTLDLELAMGRLALRLAALVLLGEQLDADRADELASHQREVVGWVGARLGELTGFIPVAPGAAGKHMKRHRAVLNAYADEVIARAQRKAHNDPDLLLDAFLTARPSGKTLTAAQLRGHVLGLFLAGNETTAAALSWVLVQAARAPEAWANVRDDPARHTDTFIDETMRLTPAVWGIPRVPAKGGNGVTVAGTTYPVRRPSVVTVYLRGINRNENMWSDPLRFDPSRHEHAHKEQQRALLPFGLGPRGCIGQHLALAEMKAVVPALARHGDVIIDEPVDEEAKFALRVKGGLKGSFTRVPKEAVG
jgi:cytochrome P450